MKDRRVWLSLLAVALTMLAFSKVLDEVGSKSTEDALVRALATYGIARALNGVISVAQGTEVAIEPAGVGVILTPGQILDPINDLVERFSWVMLVSSASLGVLNVLLSISAWYWLSIILTCTLGITLVLHWRAQRNSIFIRSLLNKLALLLIILRFAAPVIAIANNVIYQQFLQPQYQAAVTQLQQTTEKIGEINEQQKTTQIEVSDQTLMDKAKALYESTKMSIARSMDIEERLQQYELAANNASRHAIDLIVIFIFQTILLPVFFLWMTWQLSKWILWSKQTE